MTMWQVARRGYRSSSRTASTNHKPNRGVKLYSLTLPLSLALILFSEERAVIRYNYCYIRACACYTHLAVKVVECVSLIFSVAPSL